MFQSPMLTVCCLGGKSWKMLIMFRKREREMENKKTDLRVIRTRKLLMDAFLKLSSEKKFDDIKIRDITSEAMVNRSTFYSHFRDKYDLMDVSITEHIIKNVVEDLKSFEGLSKKTAKDVFMRLTEFHADLSGKIYRKCEQTYAPFNATIENKIRNALEEIFYSLLLEQNPLMDLDTIKIDSAVLSCGIYGATLDWKENSNLSAEEYIKKALIFLPIKE